MDYFLKFQRWVPNIFKSYIIYGLAGTYHNVNRTIFLHGQLEYFDLCVPVRHVAFSRTCSPINNRSKDRFNEPTGPLQTNPPASSISATTLLAPVMSKSAMTTLALHRHLARRNL